MGLVIADTREQVAQLNAAIRDHRADSAADKRFDSNTDSKMIAVARGEIVGVGDRIATRRNDRDLGVANRDTWTVTAVTPDGGLRLTGRPGTVEVPAAYADKYVELAYATTVHGAQGETVDVAHLAIGEHTGAAAAYVGMTRGRHRNTAHLVADSLEDARARWVDVFSRDRADLGPRHAAQRAAADIDQYGRQASPPTTWQAQAAMQRAALQAAAHGSGPRRPPPAPNTPGRGGRGLGF